MTEQPEPKSRETRLAVQASRDEFMKMTALAEERRLQRDRAQQEYIEARDAAAAAKKAFLKIRESFKSATE